MDRVTRQCHKQQQHYKNAVNRADLQRTGRGGAGRKREREIIYLSLHCHHQNDFCIKVGSDENDFNVS